MIITGGENVASAEVEDVLFSHPAVAEVGVIGVLAEKYGGTIKALVVLQLGGQAATSDELIDYCKKRSVRYKAPTAVEIGTELARTATGTLQKFKHRKQDWVGTVSDT